MFLILFITCLLSRWHRFHLLSFKHICDLTSSTLRIVSKNNSILMARSFRVCSFRRNFNLMNIFITSTFMTKLKIYLRTVHSFCLLIFFWRWFLDIVCMFVWGSSCLLFSIRRQFSALVWHVLILLHAICKPSFVCVCVCWICLTIPKISYNKFE